MKPHNLYTQKGRNKYVDAISKPKLNKMKVRIQNRSVYHKFAEVEIDIDKKKLKEYTDSGASIVDYLFDHSNLYDDKIDQVMSEANFEYGTGVNDYTGMNEPEAESEWRFECDELKMGGHL